VDALLPNLNLMILMDAHLPNLNLMMMMWMQGEGGEEDLIQSPQHPEEVAGRVSSVEQNPYRICLSLWVMVLWVMCAGRWVPRGLKRKKGMGSDPHSNDLNTRMRQLVSEEM
jgi:hypothetical protein